MSSPPHEGGSLVTEPPASRHRGGPLCYGTVFSQGCHLMVCCTTRESSSSLAYGGQGIDEDQAEILLKIPVLTLLVSHSLK